VSQNEDDALPPAPQPQHERVWRHPSELGFAAHTLRVEQRPDIGRTGRGLLLFSVVAGSVLLLGLVLMVRPRTASTDVDGVIELTSRSVEVVELIGMDGIDPKAMVIGDGTFLVTTWAAVESVTGEVLVTVDPRGRRRNASVVHTDENLHLAVLRVNGAQTTRMQPLANVVDVGTGAVVFVADGTVRPFSVGERTTDGLVTLEGASISDGSMTEGAPVLDRFGGLMGLYTEENSEPCFVPVEELGSLLEDVSTD
jgi:hypothetical protein